MQTRHDINGLRAVAVLPVLFFHSGLPGFEGGFLGVDVFFVISGFLITSLIYKATSTGQFSFIHFYDRRARRILPAFFFVVLITSIASIFFMVPYDLKNFGQSLVASTFSANNVLLYLTSGYWGTSAEFKPLYHTWSLAVEEQYYFVMPILLLFIAWLTKSRNNTLFVLALISMLSILAVLLIEDREYNFLMPFTRAWELLAGGLLAIHSINKPAQQNQILAAFGLSLILVSYLFPYTLSYNQILVNLPAVIGTLLVIAYANGKMTKTGELLSLKPIVGIGLTSYSIYLWHQPLLAYLRLSSVEEPNTSIAVLVSLLSIPLAYFTWKFIENPCRDNHKIKNFKFYIGVSTTASLIVALGLLMHFSYGFQNRFPEYSYQGNPQKYVDEPRSFISDEFSTDIDTKLLVIGNSFARDFINMLRENDALQNINLVYFEGNCDIGDQRKLDHLLTNSDYVVYSWNWGSSPVAIERQVFDANNCFKSLADKSEAEIFMLGGKNFGWNNNFVKQMDPLKAIEFKVKPLDSVVNFNQLAVNSIPNYIDLMGILSDNGKVKIFTPSGFFITYDTNHLTKAGAVFLGKKLLESSPLSVLVSIPNPKNEN